MPDQPLRVLVTGSRRWPAEHDHLVHTALAAAIERLRRRCPRAPIVVDHGACHLGGADEMAEHYVRRLRDHGADWISADPLPAHRFGPWPQCGPKRNAALVLRRPVLALAFPTVESTGTWDCARRAHRAGVPTSVIRLPGYPPVGRQCSRRAGARMPRSALYVGRPTEWGNPFPTSQAPGGHLDPQRWAVTAFRGWLVEHPEVVQRIRHRLAGWDLACWCPLDTICHRDVLLEVASSVGGWLGFAPPRRR